VKKREERKRKKDTLKAQASELKGNDARCIIKNVGVKPKS